MKPLRTATDIIIESLVLNTFLLECTSIQVTQQTTSENKIQYSGPGSITKGEDTYFTIKIYSAVPEEQKTLPIRFSGEIDESYSKGKIVQLSEYFKMEAITLQGEIWTAENIWLDGNVNYSTYGMLLNGSTENIIFTSQAERKNYHLNMTCLHQRFRFPCNSWTQNDLGRLRNKSEFNLGAIKCTLTILDGTLNIQLVSDIPIPKKFDKAFLNALQITTGKQLKSFINSTPPPMIQS